MKILSSLSLIIPCLMALSTAVADSAVNFRVLLSGDQEVPPVATMTTATAILHVDNDRQTIRFDLDIDDGEAILGAAGAHLHCAPEGANGPVVVFLAGMSPPGFNGRLRISGTLSDASIINPACGASIEELVDAIDGGGVYINVHSPDHPGGEIRGQIY